jgi:hypothetical protein
MKNHPPTYNERSWAIDLIGHIKTIVAQNNRSIKDAGGEQTIRTDGGSLFPDVLLFGDHETARILQGWELKMPDTPIDDFDFRDNAEAKARALGLDSFVLWNVSHAHLYIRNSADEFILEQEWSELANITTRTAVSVNRKRWEGLAAQIISYLNDLFDRGTLEGRQFIEAYRSGGITSLIMENAGEVTDALITAAVQDAELRHGMILWWDRYGAEYASGTKEQVLGQVIISNWIGKILFAHILREKDERAQHISSINNETTPEEALELFRQLSEECNFWTIFSKSLGLTVIPPRAWDHLKQFNNLLSDLRVGSVDQAQLSGILEATVEVATRKLRGQYPTPIALARVLVHLCLRNLETDKLIDPCCGSGTIARAALECKLVAGVNAEQAAGTVYASDQDPQAVQIATFALASPSLMHIPLRIFKQDAFTLSPDLMVDYRNPSTGAMFSEELGTFQAITSNLPFVAQAGRSQYGNALQTVYTKMLSGKSFTGRADVAAYLPFALHPLLEVNGRLGIIITNAWLGTEWGDDFYTHLAQYYDLKFVITSGAGRWFRNSEVVTNILIMEKKTSPEQASGDVKFIVLTSPLEEIADEASIEITAAQIQYGQTQLDRMTIRAVSQESMTDFRRMGLGGNAQFVNCDWILQLPLLPLKNIFDIRRGERRGMNKFFYPASGHGIEAEYIKPLAKSPAEFKHLSMSPTKEAFSCSRTEEDLEALGHTGALNWIRRFKTEDTISRLSRVNGFWYEMNTESLADLVMFINYGERLFVGRISPPAFADQRLVLLKPHNATIDIALHHALLNSAISMFILEGIGFGRGLGALDLNKDRLQDYMHMLDAKLLSEESIAEIISAFTPLTQREVLVIADELEQPDRIAFDNTVLQAFGLEIPREIIYESLLSLVAIRLTVME